MKWIHALDPGHVFRCNTQAAKLHQDVCRLTIELDRDPTPEDVLNLWRSRDPAFLPTRQSLEDVLRNSVSKLKKRRLVTTDTPFVRLAPRYGGLKSVYSVIAQFADVDYENYVSPYVWCIPRLPKGSVKEIFNRYRGRSIPEVEIFLELSKLPSPTGRRTMWHQYRNCRCLLANLSLIKLTIQDTDELVRLYWKLRLKEGR